MELVYRFMTEASVAIVIMEVIKKANCRATDVIANDGDYRNNLLIKLKYAV